jgi:hypothetical protein
LHTLDISNNRIEGELGGQAVADLIMRKPSTNIDLEILKTGYNNFGNKGASIIFQATQHN